MLHFGKRSRHDVYNPGYSAWLAVHMLWRNRILGAPSVLASRCVATGLADYTVPMSLPTEHFVAALLPRILLQLRDHPEGLSEYELIQALGRDGQPGFDREALRDPLGLFRTHFVLFHGLYRLREQLAERGEGLQVHCLRIRLLGPLSAAGGQALAEPDALAAYYLDLGNMDGVDEAEVLRLIGGFWQIFSRRNARDEALEVLGLQDPVSRTEIKQQYRRLAMQHHPDRGGDTAKLQALNAAVTTLGVKA